MWQWRRRPSERDVDDEIAFHLAEEARLRDGTRCGARRRQRRGASRLRQRDARRARSRATCGAHACSRR